MVESLNILGFLTRGPPPGKKPCASPPPTVIWRALERCRSGRSGSPAKRVYWVNQYRGFESPSLRQKSAPRMRGALIQARREVDSNSGDAAQRRPRRGSPDDRVGSPPGRSEGDSNSRITGGWNGGRPDAASSARTLQPCASAGVYTGF